MAIHGFSAPFSVRLSGSGIVPDDCDVVAADGTLLMIDRREVCEAVARMLNAHDDLVAACKAALIPLEDEAQRRGANDVFYDEPCKIGIAAIRAALAKAHGEG